MLLISTLSDVYSIILKGKLFMAMEAARAIVPRGGGAIVQTGWLLALQAIRVTPSAAYSVANAGMRVLPRNQALELASPKIRISTVAPAMVETPV